ncbi:MAG: type II toxin-antitoxin system VapC family toxin [Armatimonadota bacterium]
MTTIFVDTSAFYAVITHTDPMHANAAARWTNIVTDPSMTGVTSNYVVVETISLLQNRKGISAVQVFTRDMLPAVNVLWVDEAIHQIGSNALLMAGNNGPSLVDCTSFALMRAHGITRAFAFDRHFTAQGFRF